MMLPFIIMTLALPVSGWSMAFDVTNSSDGGYVIAGATGLNYKWSYAWLIKVDSQGNEIWNKTYIGECRSQAWNVVRAKDGYVIGGVTGCHGNDAWIVKLDRAGNILWQKKYGYSGKGDSATSIVGDGEGVVASITIAPCDDGCINEDVWLVRLDESGKEVWKKEIDYKEYDSIKRIKKTSDGGYIGVGCVGDYKGGLRPYGNYDIWIVKFDENGKVEWNRTFDFGFDDIAWDVAEVGDGYIIVGEVWNVEVEDFANTTTPVKAIVLKLDRNGNLEWEKFFEFGKITVGWSVTANENNKVIAGSGGNESGFIWVSAMDDWTEIIKGNFTFLSFVFGTVRILNVTDGYVVVGSKECNSTTCIWLGKLSFDGKLIWEKTYEGLSNIKIVKTEEKEKNLSPAIAVFLLVIAILVGYLIYRMT